MAVKSGILVAVPLMEVLSSAKELDEIPPSCILPCAEYTLVTFKLSLLPGAVSLPENNGHSSFN